MLGVYRAEYKNITETISQNRKEKEKKVAEELLRSGADYFVVMRSCPNLTVEEVKEIAKKLELLVD